MTTARTRRSGTTAGPREGATSHPAGKANDAMIPILIRLPRLAVEPKPSEEDCAAEDEAEIRATIPLQARDLESSLPVPDDARKATHAAAVSTPTGTVFQMPARMPRISSWSRFRFPRWAIRAGIALGLIAVLMLAFSMIRGSSKNSDKVAEFEAAGTLPRAGIPVPEMPPIPVSMPALPPTPPPTPPPAPTARMAAGTNAAATAPTASANGVPSDDKRENTSAERTATPSPVSQPRVAQYSPAAGESQAPLPPLPESPASTMAAVPAGATPAIPAASGPPVASERTAAETAGAEVNLPLTREPPGPDSSTSADLNGYPETNPATFQYPVDYHLRLPSQTRAPARETNEMGTGGPLFNGPTASGAAANGWRPNTARLQPPIEPPPIR